VEATTKKVTAKVETNVRPFGVDQQVSDEAAGLRLRLKALKLDNDAVWKREEVRREQLEEALQAALAATGPESQKSKLFAEELEATKTKAVVMIPYNFLCWTIDVLFVNRPIQRFWFLENVARMPYLSYTTMLSLYETLGWWRCAMDNRRIHFAEEWNEVQHLKIMEALGGDQLWIDRFLGRHAALFYLLILNHIWLVSPSLAYNFSELIEFHAVDTYGEFVDANKELLMSLPPPIEALDYYNGNDLYLFDEFQTGRAPRSRRPQIRNLYDVFCNIRDDELEHVKTMFQCQTALGTLQSPNGIAGNVQARAREQAVQRAKDEQRLATGKDQSWAFPTAEDVKDSLVTESMVAAKKQVAEKIYAAPDIWL